MPVESSSAVWTVIGRTASGAAGAASSGMSDVGTSIQWSGAKEALTVQRGAPGVSSPEPTLPFAGESSSPTTS